MEGDFFISKRLKHTMLETIILLDKSNNCFVIKERGDKMKLEYKHLKEMTFIGYYTEIKMNEGYKKCPYSGTRNTLKSTVVFSLQ